VQFVTAQEQIFVIDSVNPSYSPNEYAYFFEDTTQKLTLQQVRSDSFWQKMQIYSKDKPKVDVQTNYWFRLKLTNQIDNQIDYLFDPSEFSVVEYYVFDKNNTLIKQSKSGLAVPLNERAWLFNPYALPLTIKQNDTLTVIAKGKMGSESIGFKDIQLGTQFFFFEKYTKRYAIQLFFQGAFLLMFFYNLFFFFVVRDKAYLYYALYIVSMALISLEDLTFGVWIDKMPFFFDTLAKVSVFFVTLFYAQFIRYFLNIAQIRPRIDTYSTYWVYARMLFIGIIILVYSQELDKMVGNSFVLSVFMFDILLGLFFLYISWKKNPILAIYITLGYLAMTIPLSVAILKQILSDTPPSPESDGIIVQIGVLIELISFSLGLGYRNKLIEKEKLAISEENRLLVKEQNIVLEQKVSERTEELQQTNGELNKTMQTISKQRDDIISSINYALRIQNAIIPQESQIQNYFSESFVFFRPKDIVSGDFYWFADKGDTKIIAVADCTGHGVSGAFMTMIGSNILNQIVNDQEVFEANQILNLMPNLLEKTLLHSEGKVKDGMDMSIITISKNKVQYAGAMNPLYYIQNNEFKEIKADKVPIGGKMQEGFKYQNHELILDATTTFYLLSDGFQDQFGGEKDKKFMVKKLKELLFEISKKPMSEQKQILETTFDTWKGEQKQTDDVLLMGIRI
jgi:serine phosphatase RsbU (regulator of sigma subunit)